MSIYTCTKGNGSCCPPVFLVLDGPGRFVIAGVVTVRAEPETSSSASTTSSSGTTDESVAKLQASAAEALETLKVGGRRRIFGC